MSWCGEVLSEERICFKFLAYAYTFVLTPLDDATIAEVAKSGTTLCRRLRGRKNDSNVIVDVNVDVRGGRLLFMQNKQNMMNCTTYTRKRQRFTANILVIIVRDG